MTFVCFVHCSYFEHRCALGLKTLSFKRIFISKNYIFFTTRLSFVEFCTFCNLLNRIEALKCYDRRLSHGISYHILSISFIIEF